MKTDKTYTEPKLCPKKPEPSHMKKEWFINVLFYNPATQKWIPHHFKKGINLYEGYADRVYAAGVLLDKIKNDLKNGYHPYIETKAPAPAADELKFSEALDFALSNCDISDNTHKNYRLAIKYIKDAAVSLKIDQTPIRSITKKRVKTILQECKKLRKWSNASYNKYLGYFKALLTILVEWEELEYNPAFKIKTTKVEETQKYIPFTAAEKKTIREHLFLYWYKFFVFFLVIYHTGMRPKEVLALKINDLHLEDRVIRIVPEKKRGNSKTKRIREVPINDYLYRLLKQHVEGVANHEMFVFGSPFGIAGNRGWVGARHPNYFNPSFNRIKRDTVTKLWQKVVMIGLGINKHLYAGKHTGADDKILAGIDLKALQGMYGHSSPQMTEKYITKLRGMQQKQIIELSPDF